MATKKSPSYWQCQGVSGSHPDPRWMGPAWPKVRLLPRSGLLEKKRPGILAISGHCSSEPSWDQMRGLGAPSLMPSFSFTYRGVSPSELGQWMEADRQAGKLATAVNERLGMGATQGTMVVWT